MRLANARLMALAFVLGIVVVAAQDDLDLDFDPTQEDVRFALPEIFSPHSVSESSLPALTPTPPPDGRRLERVRRLVAPKRLLGERHVFPRADADVRELSQRRGSHR